LRGARRPAVVKAEELAQASGALTPAFRGSLPPRQVTWLRAKKRPPGA
jgi:hypothetical protein